MYRKTAVVFILSALVLVPAAQATSKPDQIWLLDWMKIWLRQGNWDFDTLTADSMSVWELNATTINTINQTNTNITGNLDVNGYINVTGAAALNTVTANALTVSGDTLPGGDNLYYLGSDIKRWAELNAYQANIGNLVLTGDQIYSTGGSVDFNTNNIANVGMLGASTINTDTINDGNGNLVADLSSVGVADFDDNDITTTGTITGTTLTATGTVSGSYVTATNNVTGSTIEAGNTYLKQDDLYSVANPTTPINIGKNKVGDGSSVYPYHTGEGIEFFKNANNYVSHNNAANENPYLTYYGSSHLGQKYGMIGVSDYANLQIGGSVNSLVVKVPLVAAGYDIETTRPGFMRMNDADSWDHRFITIGGEEDGNDDNVWLMTSYTRYNLDFDIWRLGETTYPWFGIHDASADKDKVMWLKHDGTDGQIMTWSGDIILNASNADGVYIVNGSGAGTVFAGSYATFSPSDKEYMGNYLSKLPSDPTELLTTEGKINTTKLGLSRPTLTVKDECQKVIIGYQWCHKDNRETSECHAAQPKTSPEEYEKLPIYETQCTTKELEGTSISDGWYYNTLSIAELAKENRDLKARVLALELGLK